MLNHQRRLPLPGSTTAPNATQLRAVLTRRLLLLQHNTRLQSLNVMHNRLRSLEGVGTMTQMRCLRASRNAIADISAVAGCLVLEDLWLQDNQLDDVAHVCRSLSGLGALTRLVLKPNPCCKAEGGPSSRA